MYVAPTLVVHSHRLFVGDSKRIEWWTGLPNVALQINSLRIANSCHQVLKQIVNGLTSARKKLRVVFVSKICEGSEPLVSFHSQVQQLQMVAKNTTRKSRLKKLAPGRCQKFSTFLGPSLPFLTKPWIRTLRCVPICSWNAGASITREICNTIWCLSLLVTRAE